MNDKLGKIGMQEAYCICASAAMASGIFTPDSAALYSNGNSAYVSILVCAGLSLGVFLFAADTMKSARKLSYNELICFGSGKKAGRILAVLTVVMLIFAAASLMERFLLMLSRFVFTASGAKEILLYLTAAILLLAWLGLEGLGRTAKLFAAVLSLSLIGALLLASGNYEAYRLAPFLGDGVLSIVSNSFRDMLAFLPAFISLLIVGKGLHGAKFAKRAGLIAGITGGAVASLCQLAMGMTYPYSDLALMHSPMYRLAMDFKLSAYFPELDLLLLFGWMLFGVLASAFYIYAASLLYIEAFGQSDIRPAIGAFGVCACSFALVMRSPLIGEVMLSVKDCGFALLSAPAVMCSLLARIRLKGEAG